MSTQNAIIATMAVMSTPNKVRNVADPFEMPKTDRTISYKIIICIVRLSIFVCLPFIVHAIEKDPLKDMDLNSLTEETSVEEKAKFLSISGYLESRNQLRAKDVDEPISLRQRLWLDCYLGQGMRIAQRQPGDEMRKCEVIYCRDLIMLEYESVPVP